MRNECTAALDPHIHVVYVISCRGEGPCKIGISGDIAQRVREIQVSNWQPLFISAARPVIDADAARGFSTYRAAYHASARKLERLTHSTLEGLGLRLMGEWFDVEPSDAIELLVKTGREHRMGFLSLQDYAAVDLSGRADDLMSTTQRSLVKEMGRINLFCKAFNEGALEAEKGLQSCE